MASQQKTLKFLCSYGGKILPRPSDGRLRYFGGLTRVLSVPRPISFSELMERLKELCGYDVTLRCQLPNEDLDVLISVKSNEELCHVVEEYDKAAKVRCKEMKIRAILSSKKSTTSATLSSSSSSSSLSSADLTLSPQKRAPLPPSRKHPQNDVVRAANCHPRRHRYHQGYACHLQASHSYHQLPLPSQFSQYWQ